MTTAELGSRALFPQLEARAYLNHASVAPPSDPVRAAVAEWLERYARLGLGAFMPASEQRQRLKETLGGVLGCAGSDLALTSSTNQGLTDLSVCIQFPEGARILGFDGEFPANTTPWQQAAAAVGGSFEQLPQEGVDDGALLEALEAALKRGGVRLVAVSAVQFSTGRAMPLAAIAELAHAHGAQVCVDAIQAVGVMPIDVGALGVDYLCGGAHKWLMGLEGVGYVYAAPHTLDGLRPRVAGWLSHEDPIDFLLKGEGHLDYDRPIRRSIDFLEGHSQNAIGCVALGAALDLILELGLDRVQAHVRAYNDALEAGLVERGFTSLRHEGSPSGTLSVHAPEGVDPIALNGSMAEQGISLSAPDGKLRFSPHWPNSLDEVPRVLEAVDKAR